MEGCKFRTEGRGGGDEKGRKGGGEGEEGGGRKGKRGTKRLCMCVLKTKKPKTKNPKKALIHFGSSHGEPS